MKIYEDFINLINALINAQKFKSQSFINFSSEEKIVLFSYFYRVIDLSKSFILLQMHGGSKTAPIILRSLLEAYLDLGNLALSPKYIEFLCFCSLNSNNKLLNKNKHLINTTYLKDVNDFYNNLKEDEKQETRLEQLKKIYSNDKFRWDLAIEKNLITDKERIIYWRLCEETHNSPGKILELYSKEPETLGLEISNNHNSDMNLVLNILYKTYKLILCTPLKGIEAMYNDLLNFFDKAENTNSKVGKQNKICD